MTRPISHWWWLLTAVSLVAIVASACQSAATGASSGAPAQTRAVAPRVGSLAPDFTLKTPDGQSITLSDLRGKPVMLNFWATWCPPCRQEMPIIQAIHKDSRYSKLTILGIDRDEDAATVAAFMQQYGYTFPTVLDPGLQVGNTYQVYAIPTTFLIAPDGVIRVKKIGAFMSASELQSDLTMIMQ